MKNKLNALAALGAVVLFAIVAYYLYDTLRERTVTESWPRLSITKTSATCRRRSKRISLMIQSLSGTAPRWRSDGSTMPTLGHC